MKPIKQSLSDFNMSQIELESRQEIEKTAFEAYLQDCQLNIIAGVETTGSSLHDGVLVLYGKRLASSPDVIYNYEQVDEDLKGKTGQPVVLINRQVIHYGCTGFGGKGEKRLVDFISLGILNGESLMFDYDQSTCVLPTAKYINHNPSNKNPKIMIDTLVVSTYPKLNRLNFDLGLDLNRDLMINRDDRLWSDGLVHAQTNNLKAATIAIGHEGITNWLLSGSHIGTTTELHSIRAMCEVLGIEKIAPETNYQKSTIDIWESRERGQRSL